MCVPRVPSRVTSIILLRQPVIAMGLAGTFGVGLTPPSAQAPTIIMTLAIADSIHILVTMLLLRFARRLVRRTVLSHSIVSFLFNAALLALTVNIAASAI